MTAERDVFDGLYTPELRAAGQVEEWLRLLVHEVAMEAAVVKSHEADLAALAPDEADGLLPPAVVAELVLSQRDGAVHDLTARIVERLREAHTPPRDRHQLPGDCFWPIAAAAAVAMAVQREGERG